MLAIVAFGVPLALNLSARVNAEVRTQAQGQADLVAATAADLLAPKSRAGLRALAVTAAASVHGRVLIVDASGTAIADSAGPAQLGASYESRPEIETALRGRQVQVQRASKTLGQEILATAVPIIHDGRTAGAVRVTQSVAAVHSAVFRLELELALIALVVLAIGSAAAALIASHIGRPLKRLEAVARQVASGELTARAAVEGSLEQRSLARSFNEMTDRIGRLLAAQRSFVADASHQLRTPLTGMRLRLEEAQAAGTPPQVQRELDAAIAEIDRLSHTVDELLVLSRAGERHPEAVSLDLDELASSAVARWRARATELGIALEQRREAAAATVWASRPDLERALDALIENALQYSPRATTVTVATTGDGIEVRDRGQGIAEDERELVFDRFHRGRAGRAGPPGSGLGLPIAQELAREWGGDVELANRAGGGMIVRLTVSFEGPHPAAESFAHA